MESLGKGGERGVRSPELLQNASPRGIRERAERGIEEGLTILHHMVQYTNIGDVGAKANRFELAYARRSIDFQVTPSCHGSCVDSQICKARSAISCFLNGSR
jgi:hypothetical protein